MGPRRNFRTIILNKHWWRRRSHCYLFSCGNYNTIMSNGGVNEQTRLSLTHTFHHDLMNLTRRTMEYMLLRLLLTVITAPLLCYCGLSNSIIHDWLIDFDYFSQVHALTFKFHAEHISIRRPSPLTDHGLCCLTYWGHNPHWSPHVSK